MPRIITVGAAQLGPIARGEPKAQVVERMLALMHEARGNGCDFVVFPELALTTFFPRWYFERQEDIDAFFERDMPGPDTQRLFDAARTLGLGFYLGYAELVPEQGRLRRFNTAITVDRSGRIVAKYRKIHLPLPAFGEAVLRGRRSWIPRVSCWMGRGQAGHFRHGHLQ
jgi:N-carbamoyl-D-amino-acid hydrolase